MKQLLPQNCPLVFLWLTWLLFLAGLVYLPLRGEFGLAAVWLVAVPVAIWGYVRVFPRISQYLGYGRVDDVAAGTVSTTQTTVTLYTSAGCPFCSIVETRLKALQRDMGFQLRRVDVTLRPNVLVSRGIRAVPVVEVEDRRAVGNATSEALAGLIVGSARTA
jgi:glutaredoxin